MDDFFRVRRVQSKGFYGQTDSESCRRSDPFNTSLSMLVVATVFANHLTAYLDSGSEVVSMYLITKPAVPSLNHAIFVIHFPAQIASSWSVRGSESDFLQITTETGVCHCLQPFFRSIEAPISHRSSDAFSSVWAADHRPRHQTHPSSHAASERV